MTTLKSNPNDSPLPTSTESNYLDDILSAHNPNNFDYDFDMASNKNYTVAFGQDLDELDLDEQSSLDEDSVRPSEVADSSNADQPEDLQNSVIKLTSHLAQVQFKLDQLANCSSDASSKKELKNLSDFINLNLSKDAEQNKNNLIKNLKNQLMILENEKVQTSADNTQASKILSLAKSFFVSNAASGAQQQQVLPTPIVLMEPSTVPAQTFYGTDKLEDSIPIKEKIEPKTSDKNDRDLSSEFSLIKSLECEKLLTDLESSLIDFKENKEGHKVKQHHQHRIQSDGHQNDLTMPTTIHSQFHLILAKILTHGVKPAYLSDEKVKNWKNVLDLEITEKGINLKSRKKKVQTPKQNEKITKQNQNQENKSNVQRSFSSITFCTRSGNVLNENDEDTVEIKIQSHSHANQPATFKDYKSLPNPQDHTQTQPTLSQSLQTTPTTPSTKIQKFYSLAKYPLDVVIGSSGCMKNIFDKSFQYDRIDQIDSNEVTSCFKDFSSVYNYGCHQKMNNPIDILNRGWVVLFGFGWVVFFSEINFFSNFF